MTHEQIEAVEEYDALDRLVRQFQEEKRLQHKVCRDLGLEFVMHKSGQHRWPTGVFGSWRAL